MVSRIQFGGIYHLTYSKADDPKQFEGRLDRFKWRFVGERYGVTKAFDSFVTRKKEEHADNPDYAIEMHELMWVKNERLVVDGDDALAYAERVNEKEAELLAGAFRSRRAGVRAACRFTAMKEIYEEYRDKATQIDLSA